MEFRQLRRRRHEFVCADSRLSTAKRVCSGRFKVIHGKTSLFVAMWVCLSQNNLVCCNVRWCCNRGVWAGVDKGKAAGVAFKKNAIFFFFQGDRHAENRSPVGVRGAWVGGRIGRCGGVGAARAPLSLGGRPDLPRRCRDAEYRTDGRRQPRISRGPCPTRAACDPRAWRLRSWPSS